VIRAWNISDHILLSRHRCFTITLTTDVGDKIKGGWNVFHGTGEGIRGNVNSFLDNVGEQIAGRGQGDAKPPTRSEEQRPAHVAANGADEMRAGMAQFQK